MFDRVLIVHLWNVSKKASFFAVSLELYQLFYK